MNEGSAMNANMNFSRCAMMYAVIIALCSEYVGHDRLDSPFNIVRHKQLHV